MLERRRDTEKKDTWLPHPPSYTPWRDEAVGSAYLSRALICIAQLLNPTSLLSCGQICSSKAFKDFIVAVFNF